MDAAGFERVFVNICNDINKNPKVFQKNADNISVSKKKAKQNVYTKGVGKLNQQDKLHFPAVD